MEIKLKYEEKKWAIKGKEDLEKNGKYSDELLWEVIRSRLEF